MPASTHIVCTHCHAVNRIPTARLHDNPSCGKCRQPLFNAKPAELDNNNFNTHITRSDIPVLVDFWAPWCGPCKMMAPAFEQASRQLGPLAQLAKLNTEESQEIAERYAIRSIPTLILFSDGNEIARQPGAMSADDIVRWASSQL